MEDTPNPSRSSEEWSELERTLKRFKTLQEVFIAIEIAKQMRDQTWEHNATNRIVICKELGISEIGLKVSLKSMLKLGILYKIKRAFYTFNPTLTHETGSI